MKASILAVGTELTQGQIVNSNASFISKKINDLGLETLFHTAVPDDRSLIFESLEILSKKSDILFVSGGLGPTTDDFTREVIVDWCNLKLVYDPATFEHIEARLTSRHVPVRENQKQQCYFPEGSKILFNSEGTAHAFYCAKGLKKVFVLPGPPKEIQAVWPLVENILQDILVGVDPVLTKSWDCLGLGESEIAHLTEQALSGHSILIGYRVHHPYVEVKLISKKSEIQNLKTCTAILEKTLQPYAVARNGADLLEKLEPKLSLYSELQIEDTACFSYLLKRFQKYIEKYSDIQTISFLNEIQNSEVLGLVVQVTESETSLKVQIQTSKNSFEKTFEYPKYSLKLKDRRGSFATEYVLIALSEFLT